MDEQRINPTESLVERGPVEVRGHVLRQSDTDGYYVATADGGFQLSAFAMRDTDSSYTLGEPFLAGVSVYVTGHGSVSFQAQTGSTLAEAAERALDSYNAGRAAIVALALSSVAS